MTSQSTESDGSKASAPDRDPRLVTFRIARYTPRPQSERPARINPFAKSNPFAAAGSRRARGRRWTQEYTIRIAPQRTVLDALLQIKRNVDPTLNFRYSCGHGMCGSDAVLINGRPNLLCTATIADCLSASKTMLNAYASPGVAAGDPQLQQPPVFRHTGTAATATGLSLSAAHSNSDTKPRAANHSEASGPTGPSDPAEATGHTDTTGLTKTSDYAETSVVEIRPLPGFTPLRDLIVDTNAMFEQIRRFKPYLLHDDPSADSGQSHRVSNQQETHDSVQDPLAKATSQVAQTKAANAEPASEYKQTPEELARYELLSTCIACGLCQGACPIYAGGEAFAGPAAMIAAARFINDSRDGYRQERLETIDQVDGIQACQSIRACTRPCPRGIDVGEEMWKLVEAVKE